MIYDIEKNGKKEQKNEENKKTVNLGTLNLKAEWYMHGTF